MQSPHNAQPSVNLGDDPDPAAELGPRLAATSQTVQGLLTNYLFYGQRRSDDRNPATARVHDRERVHDQQGEAVRTSRDARTRQLAQADPATQGTSSGQMDGASQREAASGGRSAEVPRLQLVVAPELSGAKAEPRVSDASDPRADPLAVPGLTGDPFAQDGLALRNHGALGEESHLHLRRDI